MSLRTRLFIIVSVAVLVILAISTVLVVISKQKQKNNPAGGNEGTPAEEDKPTPPLRLRTTPSSPVETIVIPQGASVKKATPLEVSQNTVRQLAKIFIERYGTYSTDNNGQNIREVQSFVTKELWTRISARLGQKTGSDFVGVTTQVLSVELGNWSDAVAEVKLQTIRTEEKKGTVSNSHQSVTVTLVNSAGEWRVKDFKWE